MDNGRMCFHTFTHFMSSQEGAMGHIDRSGAGSLRDGDRMPATARDSGGDWLQGADLPANGRARRLRSLSCRRALHFSPPPIPPPASKFVANHTPQTTWNLEIQEQKSPEQQWDNGHNETKHGTRGSAADGHMINPSILCFEPGNVGPTRSSPDLYSK